MQHVGQAGQGSGEEDTDGEDGGDDRPGGVMDIHTFCQGGGYSHFKWTGVGDLVNMIAEVNNWALSDGVAYHEVHHPPVQVLTSPRCRVYVLEMRADATLRLTSDEILCLYNIEFQNPNQLQDIHTRMRVHWVTKWMNRDDILHTVRLSELCRARTFTVTCIWFGSMGVFWKMVRIRGTSWRTETISGYWCRARHTIQYRLCFVI